jgi:ubiquinone/menaquinone biosynthesis C-methylase UbiE
MPIATSIYDDHADWYAAVVNRRGLIHLQIIPRIMELVGDVSGKQVIDIACGDGVFSRELASRGASVTGVDLSQQLLTIAKDTYQGEDLTYVHDDARILSKFTDCTFDGALCIMALMDIDDIAGAFNAVHRVTKPGGFLVVVITHPCFQSPGARSEAVDGAICCMMSQYLTEGSWRGTEDGVRSKFGAQHRTISTYLNTAINAGWNLERVIEPRLVDAKTGGNGRKDDHPGLLLLRFSKRVHEQ